MTMTPAQDKKSPSWKWIAVTAITLIGALALIIYNQDHVTIRDAQAEIKQLQQGKVNKEDYDKDMDEIKRLLVKIDDRLRSHEDNSRRRFGP